MWANQNYKLSVWRLIFISIQWHDSSCVLGNTIICCAREFVIRCLVVFTLVSWVALLTAYGGAVEPYEALFDTWIESAVNLASRIETACEVGQVYVSDSIHKLLPDESEAVGQFELKGIEGKTSLYKLVS